MNRAIAIQMRLTRDFGGEQMAGELLLQRDRGVMFDYLKQHTLPMTKPAKERLEWHDGWRTPLAEVKYESDIWRQPGDLARPLYEIHVNGEYYATTSTLKEARVVEMYPRFMKLWKYENVDIIQVNHSNNIKLIKSNYQQLDNEGQDTQ